MVIMKSDLIFTGCTFSGSKTGVVVTIGRRVVDIPDDGGICAFRGTTSIGSLFMPTQKLS